ncbi:UDP-galactopyranose mutase [Puteibacter caeruleilacunae]|nr:UDP-galactopyranose mutase [Puteibacter caeruleilacunae]
MYDYLIVGAGLFGAVFAQQAVEKGKKVLVIERRDHIAGNIYCEQHDGINVHKYGAHIFHTSDENVWKYINRFTSFNNYINSPIARFEDKLYNLPFNMNTFFQLWGTISAPEAKEKIERQRSKYKDLNPKNLEEQALQLVGDDIYHTLIKGYTEKQWGRAATELPAFIIKRIPLRFTFNNNYFHDPYQGIPKDGYNALIDRLLEGAEVRTGIDFLENQSYFRSIAGTIIYTGEIDQFYDYRFGQLEYRSLKFEHQLIENLDNYQGNAVVNYTERDVPYTRVIEHKHFEFGSQSSTIITKEYPAEWQQGLEPYYPINDDRNSTLYLAYKELASHDSQVIFGGRLGEYKYYDMDKVIASALEKSSIIS